MTRPCRPGPRPGPSGDDERATHGATYPAYPAPRLANLADIATSGARRFGASAAFERRDGSVVTYAQLNDAVDQVGGALAGARASLVELAVADPCLVAIGVLGCARAGASVILRSPRQRQAPATARLTAHARLDDAAVARLLDGLGGALAPARLRDAGTSVGHAPSLPRDGRPDPVRTAFAREDPCVVLQSSGTTGAPKAVVLTQAGVLADMVAGLRLYEFARGARTVSVIPPTHAFGLTCDLLAPLATGGTVCVPDDPRLALAELAGFAPDALNVPPIVAAGLLDHAVTHGRDAGDAGQLGRRDALARLTGGRLRKLLCGGAALPPEVTVGLRALGVEAFGCYGLTECAPCVSVNRDGWRKDGSCGVTLGCCETAISPDGEILVHGANVMRGYLGDAGATRRVLDDDGWLHTGDLGRKDADGFLWTRGRLDDLMVLPDGTKLAPEVAEAALRALPEVADALVSCEDGRIVATVRAATSPAGATGVTGLSGATGPSDEELRRLVRATPLDGTHRADDVRLTGAPLPRTTSGKLVRRHG